jgi:penicillin amidase
MKKLSLTLIIILGVLFVGFAFFSNHHLKQQGLTDQEIGAYKNAVIKRDRLGVISVKAKNWVELSQAQGYVVASERMFQLDLMRRKADGALSELFGKAALDFDLGQRVQAWRHYATIADRNLNEDQKAICDAYARGINQFLLEHPRRIGVEYTILQATPKPWSCVDSLLIVMLMSHQMSQTWSTDLDLKTWRDQLPGDWWSFAFPLRHPWNQPWFGTNGDVQTESVRPQQPLPMSQLLDADFKIRDPRSQITVDGSNSWAYRGRHGAWLANDPHLGNQVPQLWMPIRLEIDQGDWMVGTSLPGTPGILIGMNHHLAWSLTNNGEDVDDAVVTPKDTPTDNIISNIVTRGQPDSNVTIRITDKGPVIQKLNDGSLVIRQWLLFKDGILNLPIVALNQARDWGSFNDAIDQFRIVPLNFTMLDRSGNMGLRVSGCDIERAATGDFAVQWEQATWSSTCGVDHRRRLFIPANNGHETSFISTANEQIWIDERRHNWADDDRAFRIRQVLSRSSDLTLADMRLLQLDTVSRLHRDFLQWVLAQDTSEHVPKIQLQEWKNWDGNIRTCSTCMSEASDGIALLDQIILRKIEHQFTSGRGGLPKIRRNMDHARVVLLLEDPKITTLLGLDSKAIAVGLVKALARTPENHRQDWHLRNKWASQHPFFGRIPVIGRLFAIDNPEQYGASSVPLAEQPHHGPSTRLIWNPSHPEQSLWAFPTGTSGHVRSPHYSNWSAIWQQGGLSTVPMNF